MSVKSTSFPKGTLIKTFYLSIKTNEKVSDTRFGRRKTAEDDNAQIYVSPNIPCTFLLFKGNAFLQILFPIKSKFLERQFFLIVNV